MLYSIRKFLLLQTFGLVLCLFSILHISKLSLFLNRVVMIQVPVSLWVESTQYVSGTQFSTATCADPNHKLDFLLESQRWAAEQGWDSMCSFRILSS